MKIASIEERSKFSKLGQRTFLFPPARLSQIFRRSDVSRPQSIMMFVDLKLSTKQDAKGLFPRTCCFYYWEIKRNKFRFLEIFIFFFFWRGGRRSGNNIFEGEREGGGKER